MVVKDGWVEVMRRVSTGLCGINEAKVFVEIVSDVSVFWQGYRDAMTCENCLVERSSSLIFRSS